MECGGLFAMISLIKLMLMWRVDSWDLLQPPTMELWVPQSKLGVSEQALPSLG